MSPDGHRRRQRAQNDLRGMIQVVQSLSILEDGGELISSSPERHVRTKRSRYPACYRTDEHIARLVAECIVRHLQIVDVEDEQAPTAWELATQTSQGFVECRSIGQVCERIDRCAAFSVDDPPMPSHCEFTEIDAGSQDFLLVIGRRPFVAKVDRESSDRFSILVADRGGGTGSQSQRKGQ